MTDNTKFTHDLNLRLVRPESSPSFEAWWRQIKFRHVFNTACIIIFILVIFEGDEEDAPWIFQKIRSVTIWLYNFIVTHIIIEVILIFVITILVWTTYQCWLARIAEVTDRRKTDGLKNPNARVEKFRNVPKR